MGSSTLGRCIQPNGTHVSSALIVIKRCGGLSDRSVPSKNARRGDALLFEFERDFHGDWDCSHLNVIYAHESNPMDVFNSICKMVAAREEVFTATEQKAITVLSPCGWRIGSLGMLLAAIDLELPMLYVEAISYNIL